MVCVSYHVSHHVLDVKNCHDLSLSRPLQNFMYGVINDENVATAKKTLDILVELFNKYGIQILMMMMMQACVGR